MKTQILGLKELRENIQKYASRVKKGESFIVVKKSKPVFKISSVNEDDEELWETVIDFTKINKNGVDARKILKALRKLNA
ncbi:MAG: type II toxin-antitoxin system prevent-host-death family antitoxin [bacterium]|nr:type II toxin-antitoxin system prevent-host-death family antitoxin [bacterium]